MANEAVASKVRSIDFLTPEQLQRKREVDRKSQRQARERTRTYIAELEHKVAKFEARVQGLEAFVASCTCKNKSQAVSLPTPDTPQWDATAQNLVPTSDIDTANGNVREQSFDRGCGVGHEQWRSFSKGLDLAIWQRIVDNTMLATSQGFPLASWFGELQPDMAMPSAVPDQIPIWQYLPKHTTEATCGVDSVVMDLLSIAQASREVSNTNENSDSTRPAFPSIQSLLNPTYNAIKARVSRNIVDSIIGVVTTASLPERIGFLYIIYGVVRWQMNPTEATYYSLPEWMRPSEAQLYCPHPPWIDVFVWPKGREQLCLEAAYHHKHPDIVRICNKAMSCNWPYRDSDMLLQVGEETVLNPVFERHIRDLSNWTITEEIFTEFPSLVDKVNLK